MTSDASADEKWRPRNFFLGQIILSFCLLLLTIWLPLRSRRREGAQKKGVTSPFFRGYKGVLLILTGSLGLGIVGLERLTSLQVASTPGGLEKATPETMRPGGSTAVLRACAAYRVPDTQGAISARWLEGQPVRVRAAADRWAYVESPEGDAGWVRQDDIVFY
jgi:hypothetical protein